MNEPIKVSVVMCTYNGEKYLREQLDSIINQTYPIHEIIIQDDCSTDGTWEIIQEYATRNNNFRIYRNEINLSVYHNFFSAFQKVTGEYFAVSDQDDFWLPDKIKIFVEYAEKSNALLFYSDSIIADTELNSRPLKSP
ncbi:MAG: glycosyltransferase [Paludibacteraceae bacterium]